MRKSGPLYDNRGRNHGRFAASKHPYEVLKGIRCMPFCVLEIVLEVLESVPCPRGHEVRAACDEGAGDYALCV